MNIQSTIPDKPKLFSYPQMFGGGVFFLAAAAAANYFNSSLALPFASIAGANLATIFAIKLLNQSHPELTKKLLLNAIDFNERFPNLQAAAFAITLATAFIWIHLSCVFGILAGFYSGLLIRSVFIKDLQSTYQAPMQPLSAQIVQN